MPILPIDSGRYGSKEIRKIFEEESRLLYNLKFEMAVAEAQAQIKIIPESVALEIAECVKAGRVSVDRVKELEAASEHDMAAVVEALSEQCKDNSKPWIHYGLTSNDVIDSSTSMQIKDALSIIKPKIFRLARILAQKALQFQVLPAVGRTHGQHASIIAFGLKFAVWAEELVRHIERLEEAEKRFLLCKTLGVVGTGSLMGDLALDVQSIVSKKLGLYPVSAATQVIPRERLAEFIFILSLVGSTLDKIAIEIRNLQRTEIGEIAEPFKKGQMGSSAVPVKRNPIKSERVSSLAKLVRSFVNVSMDNIPLWHERDLSNSANERFTVPMCVILLDEMLNSMIKVIEGLEINEKKITSNIEMTKGQIYAEFVLEALVKKGVPRFDAYRRIQKIAFEALESGNHFLDSLKKDDNILNNLSHEELDNIFIAKNHLASSEKIINEVIRLIADIEKKYGTC